MLLIWVSCASIAVERVERDWEQRIDICVKKQRCVGCII